jgi:hypothetical protein
MSTGSIRFKANIRDEIDVEELLVDQMFIKGDE